MFTQRTVSQQMEKKQLALLFEKVTQIFSSKLKSNALLYYLLEKSNIIT